MEKPNTQPTIQTSVTATKPRTNFLIIIFVVLVCLIIFGGGGYYLGRLSVNTSLNPSNTPTISVSPTQSADPSSILTKKWSDSEGDRIFTTTNWKDFEFVNNSQIKFSINYPSFWTSDSGGQTFSVDDVKVAEIFGIINLAPGQTCFQGVPQENFLSETGFYNTFISQDYVDVIDLSGVKRITSVSEDGYNTSDYNFASYCIYTNTKETQAFDMSFMYKKTETPNADLYLRILKTLVVE